MQDSFQAVWNKLILRCPALPPKLAQDFVVNAFRRLVEQRRWSWLLKFDQFIAPNAYSGGTVNVTNGLTTITGNGTSWTSDMVGRQFRVGLAAPIYTVARYNTATSMDLDLPFGGPTATAVGYSIYQCYFTPPSNFHQFVTLWDPAFNWQLFLDVQQVEINIWDAQRASSGNAFVVSFRDYSNPQVGIVSNAIQTLGTGGRPLTSGTFTAPVNAIYTVIISTGGLSGVAAFSWNKNNGAYNIGVVTDPSGYPQQLTDGIFLSFPTDRIYSQGDTFVIQGTAISNPGLPRYELWPHQQAAHVYPFLYESRPADLNDPNQVLPRHIQGNFLMDMALEDLSLWPGVSSDKPNIYFSMENAAYHKLRNDRQLVTLERQDDELWLQNVTYMYPQIAWEFATPLGDARFLQSHAV